MAERTSHRTSDRAPDRAGLVTVRAPAKINLHLGVGAPREDGFHPLATVYQAIGVYDDVSVAEAADWSVALHAEGHVDPDGVPLTDDNIALRAGRLLARFHGRDAAAAITIRKAIPVAGGMAGGSADAAATLVGLDRLWGLDTSDEDLLRIAAELGSDVPFALLGGTAVGTGRGELVERVEDDGTWWWVVVLSDVGLATPAVYAHFDRLAGTAPDPVVGRGSPDTPAQPAVPQTLLAALRSGDPTRLGASLFNDLQPAALDLRPDLTRVLADGIASGALTGLVSGSGPSLLFLCDASDAAHDVRHRLLDLGHEHVVAAPGPVAGAHVTDYA